MRLYIANRVPDVVIRLVTRFRSQMVMAVISLACHAAPIPKTSTATLDGATVSLEVKPQRWVIPSLKERDDITFAVKITNTSDRQNRIANWFNMSPLLKTKGGPLLEELGGADNNPPPTLRNYPIVAPGTSLQLRKGGALFWQDGKLTFCFWDGGIFHYYYNLRPGHYQFALRYEMSLSAHDEGMARNQYMRKILGTQAKELLVGVATTSFSDIEVTSMEHR